MKVLLVYPLFPKTFWSFEKAIALEDHKALLPPLGLITVAAILPQDWQFKLVDRNVRHVREEEWAWADLVMLSAMIVQKEDMLAQIREAKQRNKLVAVGGPYSTALPEEVENAGADFLILDEGEITLPMFVEALSRDETKGTFRSNGEKPDVTITPVPRFDLLDLDAYNSLSVQFSRGCPFQCEFCDIIVLYGRKPRTKTPEQLLAELNAIYELGWRRPVFLVDDNFIGNKRNVKLLLKKLKVWQQEHHYPFIFTTEASVDLAEDQELMDLMVDCNFKSVFLGIETPDEESLALTRKFQNTRNSLVDSVHKIIRSGIRVMSGFIIGFDGETAGAGDRIIRFVELSTIPIAMFSPLQALPHTALWHRLQKEGRLLDSKANINQTTLPNFVPTRPVEEIAQEYIKAFWNLYDAESFLERTYQHFLMMGAPRHKTPLNRTVFKALKPLSILFWRQGVVRKTRWKFWYCLGRILINNPAVWVQYIKTCAFYEHFGEYREIVREQILEQLAEFKAQELESSVLSA